ncbi:MAG: GspE/PulE family protein [Pseudomonadota bacterium]
MKRQKIRLGDLLVENGVISAEQLQAALKQQAGTGQRLGTTLIDMQVVEETQLLKFLAQQLQIPFIELGRHKLNEQVAQKLTEVQARRYRALLIEEAAGHYLAVMSDPTDLTRIDEMQSLLDKPLRIAVTRESELMRAIDIVYRHTEQIESLAQELSEASGDQFDLARLSDSVDVSEAPVARLLQTIFEDAIKYGASDVHLEPEESSLRIRLRVDGVLQEQVVREARIAPAVVLRLKLMSNLDISEKRRPQDGRFNINVQGRNIDVRLATLPVQHGESVVMRLLDQSGGQLRIDQIGMPPAQAEELRKLLRWPHGILLVTGPTGSGKSTTLYAALNELNKPDVKIITVEDPVEYRLPRVNQVQVNTKIDLSFAAVLRTVLRADPDIIMVGEMRDQETATIGLRAALTGHLVLSTLHTNDAIQSALRLTDMGAEPYLVASTLRGIIAQRLIRKLCPHCSQVTELTPQQKSWLHQLGETQTDGFKTARGCNHCNQTGYRGRLGVFELLVINDELAEALRRQDQSGFVAAAKRAPGYRPLGMAALDFARAGATSLDEVTRVSEVSLLEE